MLDKLIQHSSMGWKIFPIIPNDKKPLNANGFKDATTDEDTIIKWYQSNPKANWGFAPASANIIVLDVDTKNGASPSDLDLTKTLTVLTPHNGYHFYYSLPAELSGFHIGNTNSFLPKGWDVRCMSGYVVIPPSSIRDEDGQTLNYQWEDESVTIQPLPSSLTQIFFDFYQSKQDVLTPLPSTQQLRDVQYSYPDIPQVVKDLYSLPSEYYVDYFKWLDVGFALHEFGDLGFNLWANWSSQCPKKYTLEECKEKWQSISPRTSEERRITYKSLHYWAIDSEGQVEEVTPELFQLQDAFRARTPRKYLIDDFLPENTITLFVGNPDNKKTFLALAVGLSIAAGIDFIGLKTAQVPVIYLNNDNDPDFFEDRIKAGAIGQDVGPWNEVPFYYYPACDYLFRTDTSPSFDDLEKRIAEKQAGLVILDSFADFTAGVDENDVKSVKPVLSRLRKIERKYHCSFIILHHLNKNGGTRGSTAIEASVDYSFGIDSPDDDKVICLSPLKHRYSKGNKHFANIDFVNVIQDGVEQTKQLHYFTVSQGSFEKGKRGSLSDMEKYVIDYCRSNGGSLSMSEFLMQVPQKDNEKYRQTVYSLKRKTYLHPMEEGKKTGCYTLDADYL